MFKNTYTHIRKKYQELFSSHDEEHLSEEENKIMFEYIHKDIFSFSGAVYKHFSIYLTTFITLIFIGLIFVIHPVFLLCALVSLTTCLVNYFSVYLKTKNVLVVHFSVSELLGIVNKHIRDLCGEEHTPKNDEKKRISNTIKSLPLSNKNSKNLLEEIYILRTLRGN